MVQTPRQHAANADVIFTGRVLEAEDPLRHPGPRVQASLAVEVLYKGSVGEAAVVETPRGGTPACGFRFEEGTRYTVFAYRNERGRLETNTCAATGEGGIDPSPFGLSSGGADAGPEDASEGVREPAGSLIPVMALVGASLLVAGGLSWVLRRRRRPGEDREEPTGGGAPPRPS